MDTPSAPPGSEPPTPAPLATAPTPPARERPTLRQAILITVGGILVAFFSCVGALAGMGSNFSSTTATEVGILGFVIGLLMFVVGVALLLWVALRWVSRGKRTGA